MGIIRNGETVGGLIRNGERVAGVIRNGEQVFSSAPPVSPVRFTGGIEDVGTAGFLSAASMRQIRGLAYFNDTLYIASRGPQTLWTVDREASTFQRVGSVANFGVSEVRPTGIARLGDEVYLLGETNQRLYRLLQDDDGALTGAAVTVSTAETTGLNRPVGLAAKDGVLYCSDWDEDTLFRLDPSTGVATRVDANSPAMFGVAEGRPSALGTYDDGLGEELYMVGYDTDQLFLV